MIKSQAAKFADHGTTELQRKGEIALVETTDGYKQAYITNQTVIERLYKRNQITELQYLAARRLQNDYLQSYRLVSLKARIIAEPLSKPNYFNHKDKMIDYCVSDSKKRYDKAMSFLSVENDISIPGSLPSKHVQRLIEWVIIEDGYLKDIKSNSKMPKVTLKHLRLALDSLVQHYNIK
jgi:hypothetical protein